MPVVFTESGWRILQSNSNFYIQPHIQKYLPREEANWQPMSLPEWQAFSGEDGSSVAAWFTTAPSAIPATRLFLNETSANLTIALDRDYVDLTRHSATGSITLPPYTSMVLVAQ